MQDNFLFNVGVEYHSFVPKCYRHICKIEVEQFQPHTKTYKTVKRINRADAEILRYIEYKVLGRFSKNDLLPDIDDLEEPIKLSNAQIEQALDYDSTTIAGSLKRLKKLGFIGMHCEITRKGDGYDSNRTVWLNCENIMWAIDLYFAEVQEKEKQNKTLKKHKLQMQEGYVYKLLKKEREEAAKETAKQYRENTLKIAEITGSLFNPKPQNNTIHFSDGSQF